jgi:hypothetical protein
VSLVSVVCCQVEVSATSWSLVQRSPTESGVSISVIVKRRKMTRPRPPKGCRAIGKKNNLMTTPCNIKLKVILSEYSDYSSANHNSNSSVPSYYADLSCNSTSTLQLPELFKAKW